jgi:SAM-dependent methyltransferase
MAVKTIIDRKQVAANQSRASRLGVQDADFLLRAAEQDLDLRLSSVVRTFERAVCLLPPAAPGGKRLISENKVGAIDIARPNLSDPLSGEALGLEAGVYDLALSLLTLHETNDTPGILAQIRRALKPDGLFMACIPGGNTLHELRESLLAAEVELTGAANTRVLPFIDVRDAGGLLQRAGFALPVADSETLTVRYGSLFHLIRDLRAMGATNTLVSRSRRFTSLALFNRAADHYAQHYADSDGRIRATFNFIWMSGWVPHDSQQKPLKPGSAKNRLSDFLGDRSQ